MRESRLTFTIATNAEELDNDQCGQESGNPYTNVQILAPITDGQTCCSDFEGQNSEPLDCIIPAHSKTPVTALLAGYYAADLDRARLNLPGWINEADDVCVESAVDGICDCELTQSLHDEEHHHSNDHETDELDQKSQQ